MLCSCGPLRMSNTFVQLCCGWTWLWRSILSNVTNLTSASWQSVTCLLQCLNRDIFQTWFLHFNLTSNSLICHQYELVKILVLPVLALGKVGIFQWTLDWKCAHNSYQPIWSLPWHWCYQLVCSPILGSNDISWLLGLMPGLILASWLGSSHSGWVTIAPPISVWIGLPLGSKEIPFPQIPVVFHLHWGWPCSKCLRRGFIMSFGHTLKRSNLLFFSPRLRCHLDLSPAFGTSEIALNNQWKYGKHYLIGWCLHQLRPSYAQN